MSPAPHSRNEEIASRPQSLDNSVESRLAAAERCILECEAALEEAETRFRNVIERNADAIVVVGKDGLIKYANAKAGRTFDATSAGLTGRPFGLPLTVGETTELDVVVNGAPRVVEMCVTVSPSQVDSVTHISRRHR